MKKNILISLLCFSLLSSQFGINIYLLYCCCSKDISYSFIPKRDACITGSIKKLCCAKNVCAKSFSHKKNPCGNKSIDYKTLNVKAEKPTVNDFSFASISNIPVFSDWTTINKSAPALVNKKYTFKTYSSGILLRKIYCTYTC